jgi:hypothetical protein
MRHGLGFPGSGSVDISSVVSCTPCANTARRAAVSVDDRGDVELPGVRERADDETPRTTTSAS